MSLSLSSIAFTTSLLLLFSELQISVSLQNIDNPNRLHRGRNRNQTNITIRESEEVSNMEWESINMTEQEEDLIFRMHRLVGDRWDLIAGRVPGREAKEIERYWIMKNSDDFSNTRRQLHSLNSSPHSSISLS